MKKTYRKYFLLLPVLALLVLALSGCGSRLEKQLREKAEQYVKTLAERTGIEDTFKVSSEKPDLSAGTDPVAYIVSSQTYQNDFLVYVSRDGAAVTDTYYTLSMKDIAMRELGEIMEAAIGRDYPKTDVILMYVSQANISGRAFSSLKEFSDAADNVQVLRFDVQGDGKTQLTEEQIDSLLIEIQSRGLKVILYPYISDAVWFDVLPQGIWITTQTGADSGAMLNRKEYVPKAVK